MDDSTAANVFRNIKSYSYETFIRSFQFKLLADITFTNHHLSKIGYVPNDQCTFCEEGSETVHHLFYECSFSHRFWKHFENVWFMLSEKYVEFTLKDVFVGRQVGESDQLLNYLLILAKLHIWNCRKRRVPSKKLENCKAMLDVKYRKEMDLASKNNKVKQFQANGNFISTLEIIVRYNLNNLSNGGVIGDLLLIAVYLTP